MSGTGRRQGGEGPGRREVSPPEPIYGFSPESEPLFINPHQEDLREELEMQAALWTIHESQLR